MDPLLKMYLNGILINPQTQKKIELYNTLYYQKKILEKYKYQISNKHCGKRFSPITEGETQSDFRIYNNINDFIDNEENNQKINFENEVNFKASIPIEFLKEIWICDTLFIYNKYRLYKPGEVRKNTNKIFDSVIKLLETYKISINFFRNYIKVVYRFGVLR